MAFNYDFSQYPDISRVRLMIADTDAANPIFQDDEVQQALSIESSQGLYVSSQASPLANQVQIPYVPLIYSHRRAAALLLDALAANKSRLAAVLELLDVKIDAANASKELRETAKTLRETEANSGAFAVAEMVNNQFQARERVWKQMLRLYGA